MSPLPSLHGRHLICLRLHYILSPPMLPLLSSNLALIEILQLPVWHLVSISSLLHLIWAAPCIETCLQCTAACMQIHLHKQLFWQLALISLEPLLTQAPCRYPSCIPVASSGGCTHPSANTLASPMPSTAIPWSCLHRQENIIKCSCLSTNILDCTDVDCRHIYIRANISLLR